MNLAGKTVGFAMTGSFCTFSRVMKEKGIEDAVRAIEDINSENGRIVKKIAKN